jgi:hypothetical protein
MRLKSFPHSLLISLQDSCLPALQQAIFDNALLQHMEIRHTRILIRDVLGPLCTHCPPPLLSRYLEPILPHVLVRFVFIMSIRVALSSINRTYVRVQVLLFNKFNEAWKQHTDRYK